MSDAGKAVKRLLQGGEGSALHLLVGWVCEWEEKEELWLL